MFINSDQWNIKREDVEKLESFCITKAKVQVLTMKETSHHNFTDLIYLITSPFGCLMPYFFLTEKNCPKELLGKSKPSVVLIETVHALSLWFRHHLVLLNNTSCIISSNQHYTANFYE